MSLPILVVASVLALSVGVANAATSEFKSPGLRATVVNRTTVVSPETRQVFATITLHAGDRRIAFNLQAQSPKFERSTEGTVVSEGPTLRAMRIQSAHPFHGLLFSTAFSNYYPSCGLGDYGTTALHGGSGSGELSRGVDLAAHQSVTLNVTYDVASDTPWLGTDYAPSFRLSAMPSMDYGFRARPKGAITLRRRILLKTERPVVTGPIAASISLDKLPSAKKGKSVPISGHLTPAQPGRQIKLQIRRVSGNWPVHPKNVVKTTVTTDAAGRFSYSGWTPGKAFLYLIDTAYPEQPGDLVADSMCGGYYSTSSRGGSFSGSYF